MQQPEPGFIVRAGGYVCQATKILRGNAEY